MKPLLYLLPLPLLIVSAFFLKNWLRAHVSASSCNSAIIHYENIANEKAYESGCNNGSSQSCEFVKDQKSRYSECLKSALINCQTWSAQYREEQERKGNKHER